MTSFCCINCTDVLKDVMDLCKENKTQDFFLQIQTLEKRCRSLQKKVHQEKEPHSLFVIDSYKSKVAKLKERKIDSHSVEYLGDKMREIGTNL